MLNKAILIGRLTADPELRRTQNNTAVTSFTLAVNRNFSKSQDQNQTDFIDIVAWSATAEFVAKWFKKGMQVAVCGRIQMRNWEDRQGNKRKSFEIIAEEVHFAESKQRDSSTKNDDVLPFELPIGGSEFDEIGDDQDSQLPF